MDGFPAAPLWLLLPGHMCDGSMWRGLRSALSSAGISSIVADITRDDDVESMARRALAGVDGDIVVVGFSLGGMVALAMQRLASDRIAGLALVDSNALPDLPERAANRRRQQDAVRAGGLQRLLAEEMMPHYFAAGTTARAGLTSHIVDMAQACGADIFVRQSEAIRLRRDSRPWLGAIRCPTLVIGGCEDRLCPPDWQIELAGAIHAADLALIEGAGHFLPLEAPAAFEQAVLAWYGRWGGRAVDEAHSL